MLQRFIRNRIRLLCRYFYYHRVLKRLQNQKRIRVVFFVFHDSVWKCEHLYKAMLKDDYFEPIILICPVVNFGKANMLLQAKRCKAFFDRLGHKTLCAINEDGSFMDVDKDLNPDVIFYTNPHEFLMEHSFYITNFKNSLTIYIPYYFNFDVGGTQGYNLTMHNLVWRKYCETDFHLQMAKRYSIAKGFNVKSTGYPGIERLIDLEYVPSGKDWKIKDKHFKRIIWAPHHTLEAEGIIKFSCFLQYSKFMLELASKYSDKVQFVFKPHPVLRSKLDTLWGVERTTDYYNKWASMPNTMLSDGDYIDLFLTSDAMIHDSGSFTVEYLFVNKPVIRTVAGEDFSKVFNEFGQKCLEQHEIAYDAQDIESFVKNIIFNIDSKKESRQDFLKNTLLRENIMPSQAIIDDIVKSIKDRNVYC